MTITKAVDAGMLLCAVVLTGVVVRREFNSRRPTGDHLAVAVTNWAALQRGGHRIGPASAPVTIVEFSDFQCPYCAKFVRQVLTPMRKLHPSEFALIYRHWPLPMHDFAMDAAAASECAANTGRFEAFHDALFSSQDAIGVTSFERFAVEAGIADTNAFRRCRTAPSTLSRVTADRDLAKTLNSGGTPTFIVDGVLLRAPLDSARLDSILASRRH